MIFKQVNQTRANKFRINYNLVGRKYYAVSDSSGVPAADFLAGPWQKTERFIVTRDLDDSANISEQPS